MNMNEKNIFKVWLVSSSHNILSNLLITGSFYISCDYSCAVRAFIGWTVNKNNKNVNI